MTDVLTKPETHADDIPRLSPSQLAGIRTGAARSRWVARLFVFGEVLIPEERKSFGYDAPWSRSMARSWPRRSPRVVSACR